MPSARIGYLRGIGMSLLESIELLRGNSYQEIFAQLSSRKVSTLGAIRGDDLRDVVSILAAGLQYRLETAAPSEIRTALLTGFAYMALPDYAFNLAQPNVMGMLALGVQEGLVTEEERNQFVQLATYDALEYPDLKMVDIVEYLEPELLNVGEWVSVEPLTNKLRLRLTEEMPESTLVRIEMSESDDGIDWTDYKRVNHFYGVYKPDFYFASIPNNGLQRRIRVRGETYRLTGTVQAV